MTAKVIELALASRTCVVQLAGHMTAWFTASWCGHLDVEWSRRLLCCIPHPFVPHDYVACIIELGE